VSWLILAVLIPTAIAIADWSLFDLNPLREGEPDLTPAGLMRCAGYLIGAACLGRGMYQTGARIPERIEASWQSWPLLLFAVSQPVLVMLSPGVYLRLAGEDGIAEWLTVVFFVAASLLAARAAMGRSRAEQLGYLGFAAAAFLIAGEEVSWGQRIFGFSTPESFGGNIQNEMNFHNFNTGLVETAFYFLGGFVLFALVPMLDRMPQLQPLANWPIAQAFRPRPYLIPAGAAICAMNYDMWNGVWTQVSFWCSLAVLAVLATAPANRALALTALVLCAGAQFGMLDAGVLQLRPWDITEFKEMAIGGVFLLHAIDMNRKERLQPELS